MYPTADHGVGKRWQVRWRDDNGRQPKRNFSERYGDDPERHAEAFDAKIQAELNAGTYIDPEAGKVTVEQFAKQWRAGVSADPYTLEIFDNRLAHIYDVEASPKTRRAEGGSVIGQVTMAHLAKKPSLVNQWIAGLERKGLSAGYIKDIFDALSSLFIAAIDDGIVAKNPTKAKSIRLPTIEKKVIEVWTQPMVISARTFLEKVRGAGAMVDLGAGAGLRQGEIFGVAEEDIVFLGRQKDRKIRVRRQVKYVKDKTTGRYALVFAPPKGGKERDVPLSDALGRRLSAHIKAHPPVRVTLPWRTPDNKRKVTVRLLFVRADGRPWDRKSFIYTWHRLRRHIGAPETRENGMHVLRHTYASVTLANGVDIIKLAAWLGHSDPGFTLRTYTHFLPDVEDKGREAVDRFLEPPEDGRSALDVPSGGEN
jgi:integrase